MSEVLEAEVKTEVTEPSQQEISEAQVWGDDIVPHEKTELIVEKKEEPIVEKRVEPVVEKKEEVVVKAEPVIEKTEPVIEKKEEPIVKKYALEGKEDEVYSYLQEKKSLEKLTTAEITKDNAAEIVKFGMGLKNKDLTPTEIDRLFNRKFQMPAKPTMEDVEKDTDISQDNEEAEYKARLDKWQEQVDDLNMDIGIEAKMLKPDLEKYKAELKQPDIYLEESAGNQPSQEDLENGRKFAESYAESAPKSISELKGFDVVVKDPQTGVEISTGYQLSEDEKTSVSSQMNTLAERGFDANVLFAERWINADGTANTVQVAKDLARILTEDKVDQKIANDMYAKTKLQLIKEKSNIEVGGKAEGDFVPDDKKAQHENEAQIWGR